MGFDQVSMYVCVHVCMYVCMYIHCKKLLQMLPVEVAVILQYYCESAVTCC